MIVVDANILIRAVLGRRVLHLLTTYSRALRFHSPDIAYTDAEKYLPRLLRKYGKAEQDAPAALRHLQERVEPLSSETYGPFEMQARERLRKRDEADWPVLASAMALCCAIWTEDADFFGIGIPVWTTDRIEIFLREQARLLEQREESS